MTISADILALSPVLYWKLDEATGPAASDSSGHSHPGVYGGPFTLHQPGPEPDTFAAQFASTASVTCTNFPQPGSLPWTVTYYCSRNVVATPAAGDEFVSGSRAATRGAFLRIANTPTYQGVAYTSSGTALAATAQQVPTWDKWWHAYALSWAGSGGLLVYVDGVQTATTSTLTMGTTLAADTFGLTPPYGAVIAHLAYFDKQLTAPQIATLHGYRYDWPFGPMVNMAYPVIAGGGGGALSPSDPVVVDINADLSDIRRAVLYDYTTDTPPP